MGLKDQGTCNLGFLRITSGSSQSENSCSQLGGVCPLHLTSEIVALPCPVKRTGWLCAGTMGRSVGFSHRFEHHPGK